MYQHFKHQPHKMVKHTKKIRRLLPTNYLSVFDHFVGLALNGLNRKRNYLNYTKVTFSVFNWLVWAVSLLFFKILVLVIPAFSTVAFKLRIMSAYLATSVSLDWSFQVASKRWSRTFCEITRVIINPKS